MAEPRPIRLTTRKFLQGGFAFIGTALIVSCDAIGITRPKPERTVTAPTSAVPPTGAPTADVAATMQQVAEESAQRVKDSLAPTIAAQDEKIQRQEEVINFFKLALGDRDAKIARLSASATPTATATDAPIVKDTAQPTATLTPDPTATVRPSTVEPLEGCSDKEGEDLLRRWRAGIKSVIDDPSITSFEFKGRSGETRKVDARLLAKWASEAQAKGADAVIHLTEWVIKYVNPEFPLSPEEAAQMIGGRPENWIFAYDPDRPIAELTGELWYEAFSKKEGVEYEDGVGPVKDGRVLSGIKQTNAKTSEVFNFNIVDEAALIRDGMKGLRAPGMVFTRTGEYGLGNEKNIHRHAPNGADINPPGAAVEQASVSPVAIAISECDTTRQVLDELAQATAIARAKERTAERRVKRYYWSTTLANWVRVS